MVKLPNTISLVNTAEKAEQYRFTKSGKSGNIFTNIQKIAIAEKYRPIYEKQAKANQGTRNDLKNNFTVKLPESNDDTDISRNPTTAEKLASIANVSEKTYRMGAKILNSDNEKLKQEVLQDLLETNIRRRGDAGGSSKKVGKRIKELERIYGIKVGNPNYENNSQLKTQSQLASDMGIDVRTLQNYKMLADMIPELSDLVDTRIVTKTTALDFRKMLIQMPDLGELHNMRLKSVEIGGYFDLLYWTKVISPRNHGNFFQKSQ